MPHASRQVRGTSEKRSPRNHDRPQQDPDENPPIRHVASSTCRRLIAIVGRMREVAGRSADARGHDGPWTRSRSDSGRKYSVSGPKDSARVHERRSGSLNTGATRWQGDNYRPSGFRRIVVPRVRRHGRYRTPAPPATTRRALARSTSLFRQPLFRQPASRQPVIDVGILPGRPRPGPRRGRPGPCARACGRSPEIRATLDRPRRTPQQ